MFSILLPIFIGISSLEISSLNLVHIFLMLILGFIITLIIFLRQLIYVSDIFYLSLMIIPELLYLVQIIILTNMDYILIHKENLSLIIDIRILYFSFIGLPILNIIRNTFKFITQCKERKCKLIVLSSVYDITTSKKKIPLKKHILNSSQLDIELKKAAIKNSKQILEDLKKSSLIKKSQNKYTITDLGLNTLFHKQTLKILNKIM